MSPLRLAQVALSTTDLMRSYAWYREVLGLVPGGDVRRRGEPMAGGAVRPFDVACLIDQQHLFQLEIFQLAQAHPMPPDRRHSDIGYASVAIYVTDFDGASERARRTGSPPLTAPHGAAGERRVCVRDPDGVFIELMERDVRRDGAAARPREALPACIRAITLSVPDLARARRLWVDTLGCIEAAPALLHTPECEALWGDPGAERDALLLWLGDVLIELVHYRGHRPWREGHHYSDQGILNVALLADTEVKFEAALEQIQRAGYAPDWPAPLRVANVANVIYITDDQGFSIELMFVPEAGYEYMGFVAT